MFNDIIHKDFTSHIGIAFYTSEIRKVTFEVHSMHSAGIANYSNPFWKCYLNIKEYMVVHVETLAQSR